VLLVHGVRAAGPVGSAAATHAMLERRERRKEAAMEYDSATHCAVGCKNAYLGDRNCDEECYNESCEFDQGDCEDQWEVRRTVVLGAFFKEVDHVEYTAVGPNGATKGLSMEEGRHWEGNDVRTREERANWRRMLKKDKETFKTSTDMQRPAWYLDNQGDKVPAYKVCSRLVVFLSCGLLEGFLEDCLRAPAPDPAPPTRMKV